MNLRLLASGINHMQPDKQKADWNWHSNRPLKNKLFENIIYRAGDKRK
ncbi:hypothetical protein [Furfurilactobacillus siliginis]|uniref:Uncharacterized protein n=1 Tax=Furfurilactobacillus siliginis TaxID=348151 RepID=A0A510VNH7_9LACO|nr:hypothetical protein [Furfurilactobacillus siliginis]GEK28492.1 hypothetical protein LSI01_08030 [Furfurilactobacillus siliginis]